MKTLLKHLKSYSLYCVLGPLFKLLEVVFELYVPLVLKDLIEIGIKMGDDKYVLISFLKILLLGIFGFLSALSAQLFAAKASARASSDMKKELFENIQSLSFSQLESLGASTLYSRMTNDMNQIQSGVNLALRLLLRSPFVVFGAMVMAFQVNTKSALYFVVVIPLLFLLTFAILIYTIPLLKKEQKTIDRVVNSTRENLTGTRVIRAFRHEETEIIEFTALTEQLTQIQNVLSKATSFLNPVTTVVVNLFILLLIKDGRVQFYNGAISQGEVLALYNYMSMILVELIKLSNLVITISRAITSSNRVEEIINLSSEDFSINEKPASDALPSNEVLLRDVSYCYPDSPAEAISDISLALDKGETLGIIGGIGSGKSTLANIIAGYYRPTHGHVWIEGLETSKVSSQTIRDKIGFVFQKASLFSGTIRSNLSWGSSQATDSDMIHALEAAQAWDFLSEKNGLDTVVEREGKNFSGGQRQRLCIARALVKQSPVLILDDSYSALDYITESKMRNAIAHLEWHPTTITISQRISSIQHADHILVLKNGAQVGYGSHQELLSNCDEYREIALSQGIEVTKQ
ncbi:MAG: ABC transporter ATP-binding protein [Oscillospiraceae bacterium]|nr:ABC transporter ATP-binding protein [Oscillospiraceae bacterium]